MQKICTLLGVPFHYGTHTDLMGTIGKLLEISTECALIFTPNPEILMIAEYDEQYKKVLQQATLSLPDGNGLLFASSFLKRTTDSTALVTTLTFIRSYASLLYDKKYLRNVIPSVIPGSDTFFALHNYLSNTPYKVFYFGGEDGVEEKIQVVMKEKYPEVQIVGSTGGYPFKNPEAAEHILQEIERAKPDILFIALSFPWQERWAVLNKKRLSKSGVKVAMVVGGTFDFAIEKRKRAPVVFQKLQIEWLWRLLHEPSRLGRIMKAVITFPLHVLKKRLSGEKDLLVLFPPVAHLHK